MTVLRLRAPAIAENVRAGQFVNLALRPGPFLRRPFSVYGAERAEIEILLKVVGAGTALLERLEPGARVGCLGPLGRPFDLDRGSGALVLASGGLGVAPMPLAARNAARAGREVIWVHGARTAGELCREWHGDRVIWATDDGSTGARGSAIHAIPDVEAQVLACGPNPMLSALSSLRPEAQVAIETYMACGTGVCLGCAVPLRRGGYDRACTEGPVYEASEIDWKLLPGHLHYAVGA